MQQQERQSAQRAFARARPIDGASTQTDQPPPADTAYQVGILHVAKGAVTAKLLVKTLGDQKPLVAIGQREQHGAQSRLGFGAAGLATEILQRKTEYRGARTL